MGKDFIETPNWPSFPQVIVARKMIENTLETVLRTSELSKDSKVIFAKMAESVVKRKCMCFEKTPEGELQSFLFKTFCAIADVCDEDKKLLCQSSAVHFLQFIAGQEYDRQILFTYLFQIRRYLNDASSAIQN